MYTESRKLFLHRVEKLKTEREKILNPWEYDWSKNNPANGNSVKNMQTTQPWMNLPR